MRILRLAVQLGWRGGWRALVYPLVAFVPFLLVMSGITAANSLTNTAAENSALLRDQVVDFQVADSSGQPLHDRTSAEALWERISELADPVGYQVQARLVVRSDSHVDVAIYVEQTWGRPESAPLYRVIAGHLPTEPGEVVLTEPLARKLDVEVGDTVHLTSDRTPVQVVGVALYRLDHRSPMMLAGPGTWWTVDASEAESLDTAVFVVVGRDDAPKVASELALFANDTGIPLGASTPFYITQALLVLLPVVLAVAAALGALVLLRFRRLGSDLVVASALGLTNEQVRTLALATHLSTIAPATMFGAVSGLPVGIWISPWAASLAHRDIADHALPWGKLGVVMVAGLVVTTIITALISSRLVKELNAGAAGRPVSDSISITRLRWWPYLVLAAGGAGSCWIGWAGRSSDPDSRDSVTSLLFTVGALMVCAAVVIPVMSWTGQSLRRISITLRFPVLQASRDRGRSTAIVLTTMIAITVPLSIVINQASYQHVIDASYRPTMPEGQILIRPQGYDLSPQQIQELTDAAGARVVPLPALGRPSPDTAVPPMWWDLKTTNPNAPGISVRVMDSVDDITAVSGYQPTPGDMAALESGALLVFVDDVAQPGQLAVSGDGTLEAAVHPVNVHHAEAPVDFVTLSAFGAVVLRDTLPADGDLQPVYGSYRILGGGEDRIEAVRAIGASFGIPPDTMAINEPFPEQENPESEFTITITIGFAALLLLLLTTGVLRERTRDLHLMSAFGAPAHTIRATTALLVTWPLLWGMAAGLVTGIIAGWISFLPILLQSELAKVTVPIGGTTLALLAAILAVNLLALFKARSVLRSE